MNYGLFTYEFGLFSEQWSHVQRDIYFSLSSYFSFAAGHVCCPASTDWINTLPSLHCTAAPRYVKHIMSILCLKRWLGLLFHNTFFIYAGTTQWPYSVFKEGTSSAYSTVFTTMVKVSHVYNTFKYCTRTLLWEGRARWSIAWWPQRGARGVCTRMGDSLGIGLIGVCTGVYMGDSL